MADSPPKGKANPLTRKLGPLPVWAWAAGGLLLGWYVYRRFTGASGSSGAAVQTQQVAAATPDTSMGVAPSAGAPADTGTATSDLISSLGGENQSLISALTQVNADVAGIAQSQIAYASTQTSMGSFNTQTQPAAASQPGGSNAPVIMYMAPNVVAPQAGTGAAAAAPVKAPSQTPTRYFSYKRDVPLASGQTVHFTTGRGYYAYG